MKEKNLTPYLTALISFIFGVYFIIKPEQSFATIAFCIGLIIVLSGIFKIISFILAKESPIIARSYLVNGVVNFLFGLVIMLNKNAAIKIIPIIVGFWLTIKGASNLLIMISYQRFANKELLIKNIITLLGGILILTTPIISIIFSVLVIGIILILVSVYLIIDVIKNKKTYSVKIK